MEWAEAVEVLDALDAAGVTWWVAGGWGVDALAGRQTREHRDLDLLVDASTCEVGLTTLARLGYEPETDWLPLRVEVGAPGRGWVDVHPVRFGADGVGVQGEPPGPDFTYPPDDFTEAVLEGRRFGCLTAGRQQDLHRGYDPRPQDRHDLAVLAGLAAG